MRWLSCCALALVLILNYTSPALSAPDRPNILWLTSEDHGPQLGCYGDRLARTPNADRLASQGMRFSHVWSNAPVCAPARTTIISGMYPTATGSEHMRSLAPYPAERQMFPQYLRAAGYYCTNNAKEDYNLAKPGQVWDASSKQAHWKNRKDGQPFFAVFNSEKSHESRIRTRPHELKTDPLLVRIPAYHPDTPEVRHDWAQYYDGVAAADADLGERLRELDAAGLAEDTIVIAFADHGSGMPRSKRWPYNSGLHVPLIVRFPAKWARLAPAGYAAGGRSERLVSFVDLAPTMLSLAGVKPPEWMHGRAFAGEFVVDGPQYLHGFRGRMDERLDLVRTVTDGRYAYVRNYLPHLIYGQHVDYMFQTPTTQVWKRLHDAGKLNAAQDAFWNTKPPEELYDLQTDPDEIRNLAGQAEYAPILNRLRSAQQVHAKTIRDVGFVPEGERFLRQRGQSPMQWTDEQYAFERIFAMAELASRRDADALPRLQEALNDPDNAIRYWAILGLHLRGAKAVAGAEARLSPLLQDPAPCVRIAAAEALLRFGRADQAQPGLAVLLELARWDRQDVFTVMAALNALNAASEKAMLKPSDLQALPTTGPVPDQRYASYVPRLVESLQREVSSRSPAR